MALTRACCIACRASASLSLRPKDSGFRKTHVYMVWIDAVRGDSALQAVSFLDELVLASVCTFEFLREGFELDVEFEDGAHVGEALYAHERELGLQVGLFPVSSGRNQLSRSLSVVGGRGKRRSTC